MVGVSSLGVGSGLDLQSLVDGLVSAETTIRLGRLDSREGAATEKISAYGLLRSALAEFDTALQGLSSFQTFEQRDVTSSNSDAFSVDAAVSAPLGTFDIAVNQVAVAQQLTATGLVDVTGNPLANAEQNIGGGQITIQQGIEPAFVVNISSGASSLSDIAAAINASSDNSGVSASAVTGDAGTVLVLRSTRPGSDNLLKVTIDDVDGVDDDNAGLSQLSYDTDLAIAPRFVESVTAEDAEISVSGQLVTSSNGNSFDEVIAGVSISISEVTASTETFTISKNTGAANESIEAFVEAYNALSQNMQDLGRAGIEGAQSGALVGDSVLRNLSSQLRQAIFFQFSDNTTSGLTSFSDLGVSFDREGQLNIDSAKLSAALRDDFETVAKLLTSSGENVPQSQEFRSSSFSSLTDLVGDVSVTIGSGDDSFVLDLAGLDLVAARDAINAATDNIGVTASLVLEDNGAGGTSAVLFLAGNTAGETFTVSVEDNGSAAAVALFSQSQAAEVFEPAGLLAGLERTIGAYLKGDGGVLGAGIIAAKTDGLSAEVDRIDEERTLQQRRLEDFEARLVAQYSALDQLVSSLQSNGNFLLSQLNSISQISSGSSNN